MKKLFVFLFVLGLSTMTFAQADIATKAEKSVEKLDAQLDLTPEQEAKIKDLYITKIESRKKRQEIAKADRKTAKQDFQSALRAILTPEQAAKYDELKAAKKASRKGNKMARKGQKRADKMSKMTPEQMDRRVEKATAKMDKRLDLTDAQEDRISDAYRSFYLKSMEIANDQSATAEDKKQLFKDLSAQHKSDIDAILTPEQLAKRKAMRAERKEIKKSRTPDRRK